MRLFIRQITRIEVGVRVDVKKDIKDWRTLAPWDLDNAILVHATGQAFPPDISEQMAERAVDVVKKLDFPGIVNDVAVVRGIIEIVGDVAPRNYP